MSMQYLAEGIILKGKKKGKSNYDRRTIGIGMQARRYAGS